ncbi:Hypothetical predicted protein [Pelobates cultripes]|uniref:Uncharacterized protein n=1 Tax=Pelobates cultripes TaxID=61616 RepID=A0AAD1TB35_PELCU|nr:Hypothetical predicted protein [Pelobates cultripes]
MSAIGVMSNSLSQTFAQALIQAQRSAQPSTTQALPLTTPVQPHSGRKALAKVKHFSMSKMDSITPVTDDSESDLSNIEEESYIEDSGDPSDPGSNFEVEESYPFQDTILVKPAKTDLEHGASGDTGKILDPHGEPLFDPDELCHPRSAEWSPSDHVARYIASSMRKPLDKNKVLDILGPAAKILEVVEDNQELVRATICGWIQRVICLIGNANTAMATERCKSILLKIEPKLVHMALNEPGAQANGLLFGENFVKELTSFIHTFPALDKAQSNIHKVVNPRVFGGARRARSHLSGRVTRSLFRQNRAFYKGRDSFLEHCNSPDFFQQRGRPWIDREPRGAH